MDPDQNDENNASVTLQKSVHAPAAPVDRLHDPPTVERRQRNKVEHAEWNGIHKQIERQHFQKQLQRVNRDIYITGYEKIQRTKKKCRQIVHWNARDRGKSQSFLVMIKVVRIDGHRFRPAESGERK